MATPQGRVERLYFSTEGGVYPAEGTFGSNTGLRMYFDRFRADAPRTNLQGVEFGAVTSAGKWHPDLEEYSQGEMAVEARLDFTMRYSGVHAVLLGLALGDLVSANDESIADFSHTATLSTTQDTATFIHQLAKTNTSTFVEQKLVGAQVESVRLEHSSKDALQVSINFIGSHLNFSTSTTSSLPSVGNGYTPDESRVMWSHKYAAAPGFTLTLEGQASVNLACRRWRITVEQGISRYYTFSGDNRTNQPRRLAPRIVTGDFEIEQNDEWREAMEAYGYLYNDGMTDADIELLMTPGYGQGFRAELNNCRIYEVGRDSDTIGSKYQRFRCIARQQISGDNIDEPLRLTVYNNRDKPVGYVGALSYGHMVTP